MPREHGAWAMLYLPCAMVLAGVGQVGILDEVLLLGAMTGVFFCQNAVTLWLRGREGLTLPLAVYGTLTSTVGIALLMRAPSLAWLAGPVALFLGFYGWLVSGRGRRKAIRSIGHELLAVAVLNLSAPAAWVVARGRLEPMAFAVWGACGLFYGSSIFYVKMRLAAARRMDPVGVQTLRSAKRQAVGWAVAQGLGALVAVCALSGPMAWGIGLAFAPAILRTGWGVWRLPPGAPNLRRIGLLETAYALFFSMVGGALLAPWR